MERTSTNSSMISGIAYDESTATLEIEFRNGGAVWQYYDFPEYMWHEFRNAESLGKYFAANIRHQFIGKCGRVG
jgi:hypothetical protein